MRELAAQNQVFTSLIGQGYSGTILPAVIQRNILESPAWYTAYTPYQPEISQGRLEALFNFQTMICDLTGLDVANASLLDEATAAAEAMALAERAAQAKSKSFFVDAEVHPQTLAVLRTRAEPLGWNLIVGDPLTDLAHAEVFGGLLQYPGTSGAVRDLRPAIAALHAKGALAVVAADLLGADADRLARRTWRRYRYRLGAALWRADGLWRPARGLHVGARCAKALAARPHRWSLSGFKGAAGLSAGAANPRTAHPPRKGHLQHQHRASAAGGDRLDVRGLSWPRRADAYRTTVHRRAVVLAAGLAKLGFAPQSQAFFDTMTVAAGAKQNEIVARALAERINLRIGEGTLGIAVDETTTPAVVEAVWRAFGGELSYADVEVSARETLPLELKRDSAFLIHSVFHAHRSETELLRYMRKLSDRDLALDRAMIPLGSCTMKLNATTEMIPLTWPEFGHLHPFAPADQARGYHAMFKRLEQWLCDITGYDAVSLQPNSGAQGEYAGLLAIRAYHAARGEPHRKVCLIPSSAHGTNPASAHMVGMEVVVTACDIRGDVDVDDLRAKAEKHSKNSPP